jgi:hypothetical protein
VREPAGFEVMIVYRSTIQGMLKVLGERTGVH